ncbi:MAG: hypothetical protein ABII18_10615 [bacterium]
MSFSKKNILAAAASIGLAHACSKPVEIGSGYPDNVHISTHTIAVKGEGSGYTAKNLGEDLVLAGAGMPSQEEVRQIKKAIDDEERMLDAVIYLMRSSDAFLKKNGLSADELEVKIRKAHENSRIAQLQNRIFIKNLDDQGKDVAGTFLERFFKKDADDLVVLDAGRDVRPGIPLHEFLHADFHHSPFFSTVFIPLKMRHDGNYGRLVVQEGDIAYLVSDFFDTLTDPASSLEYCVNNTIIGEESENISLKQLGNEYHLNKKEWAEGWVDSILELRGKDLASLGVTRQEFATAFSMGGVWEYNHERTRELYGELSDFQREHGELKKEVRQVDRKVYERPIDGEKQMKTSQHSSPSDGMDQKKKMKNPGRRAQVGVGHGTKKKKSTDVNRETTSREGEYRGSGRR